MKALLVFYEGSVPTTMDINDLVQNSHFINEITTATVFDEKSLSRKLVEISIPAKQNNTEDGDQALTFLAGITRSMEPTNLSLFIGKWLNKCEENPKDDKSKAFLRAISIIASDAPISHEIREKYGLTRAGRKTIKDLYRLWSNNEQNIQKTIQEYS